jgi:hypothetical protein
MSDHPPEPVEDDPEDRPGGDALPSRSDPSGGALIGPAFGILLGYLVIRLLPSGTALIVRLLVSLVVIAVVTYITLEITRRRAKR